MTHPEVPLDGDLAWAIGDWLEKYRPQGVEMPRAGIESLTRWLSHEGYGKVKLHSELGILGELPPMLDRFKKLADEYLKGPRESASH